MRSKKINLINAALFIVCLICVVISYNSPSEWSWGNLLLSLAVALFQLFLGILIVNIYLEKEAEEEKEREKEKAKREKENAIKDIQNIFKYDILQIRCVIIGAIGPYMNGEEYTILRNNLNQLDSISKQIKANYIKAIKDYHHILINNMDLCMQQIKMLMSTGLLNTATEKSESEEGPYYWCLGANRCFNQFKNANLDDTNETDNIIKYCESFLELLLRIAEKNVPGSREEYNKELLKLYEK